MTTGLVERKIPKCERYWPEGPTSAPLQFGDITVTTTHVEKFNVYQVTTLKMQRKGITRIIKHFWYTAWPDHGVPTNKNGDITPDDVLSFLECVNGHRNEADQCSSPCVVHCSAGVGRTGTFIVIDHVMERIKSRSKVDLNVLVSELREDRMALVQHSSQYKFAYQACINYAKKHVMMGEEIYALASTLISDPQDAIKRQNSWKKSSKRGLSLFAHDPNSAPIKASKSDFATIEEGNERDSRSGTLSLKSRKTKRTLTDQPWYRRKYTREQVAETLRNRTEGMFIVRPSTKPGHFSMSVLGAKGMLHNYLIIPVQKDDDTTGYKFGPAAEKIYANVVELVENEASLRKLDLMTNDGSTSAPVKLLQTNSYVMA